MDDRAEKQLAVLLNGRLIGQVRQDLYGAIALEYDNDWRVSADAMPVSLSLPLRQRVHDNPAVRAFLWGLLPDNEQVLERWGRVYSVSSRNPFALLQHVGEDCAGAVQFAPVDRVASLLAGEGGIATIDEKEIGQRIRLLRSDPSAWHASRLTGQFSLAGAQAKTALYFDPESGRWGDPWGRSATTHIIKPAVAGFDDHDLNEHLCLEAARSMGITAAFTRVASFDGERVIVVERYDRVYSGGMVVRVHQEDMCQALGVTPTAKYQNEGGPTPEQIIGLIRNEVRPAELAEHDVARFVDALAFNWIIAGTDAHAKNYSVLISGARVRLAPLYDLASALPYDDMYLPKLRMAMKIGGEYRLEAIDGRRWRRFAEDNGLDPDAVVDRVRELAERAPAAFAEAAQIDSVRELHSELPARLAAVVEARAGRCVAAL